MIRNLQYNATFLFKKYSNSFCFGDHVLTALLIDLAVIFSLNCKAQSRIYNKYIHTNDNEKRKP